MSNNTGGVTLKENTFLGEKYYKVKHKSGLDIYVFPKELTTSYAVFGVKYGSIDNKFRLSDKDDYTAVPDGIAHFLEHKMFENEDGEDTFVKYARTGASANAYTSFNMTVYLFSCTSRLYDSLEILLDFVSHPYFTPATVEKEQGIIAQEIKMGEDNPGRNIIFDMLQSLYAKHNVRIEIAGTVQSISEITADVLYKCYNTFYNLNNMALCVCGDADTDKVLEVADKILKEQPLLNIESVYAPEDAAVSRKHFTRKMQVAKPLFNIGVKDIQIDDDPIKRLKKSIGISILDAMLFGKSSTFYNALYEEGYITSLDCWSEHNQAYSFISVSGESKDPDEVYKRFCEYIGETHKNGLNKNDYERCKRVLYASYIKSFDSTDEIANNFLNYIFENTDIFDYVDVINTIDYGYISELYADLFKEDHFALNTVYPFDKE
jgi:predicted Zn-dependent peptidase